MTLQEIGYTEALEEAFAPFAERGLAPARVVFRDRERCRIWTHSGESGAAIAGSMLGRAASPADLPVVGDWVATRILDSGGAVIEAVLPRRSAFSRRAAGRRESRQVIAANIDVAFLVCGLDGDFNLRRLERYLTLAWESGADPVVTLNKADLCPDLAGRVSQARSVARSAPVIAISARSGRIAAVQARLGPQVTAALLGSSGAGKSTLLNALLGEERQRTGEVLESGRGRHTTTFRELVPLPGGGAVIDTPGMRELQLWAGEESVERAFDEVADLARRCRFRDCSHQAEPDCAVRAALEEGSLETSRWESYRKLLGEARRHASLESTSAARVEKQRWKGIRKAQRKLVRDRARERPGSTTSQ